MTLLGAVVAGVFFLQPWRRCAGEDTSTVCAMLPGDAAVLMIAMLATSVGLLATIAGLIATASAEREADCEAADRSPTES